MAFTWGWTEKKFYKSTPKYFYQVWKGKRDERERQERLEWERLRMLGTWVLSPYSKGLTPKKLIQFPWDIVEDRKKWLENNKDFIPVWDKLAR